MTKPKACLNCKTIYEGSKCPNCGESATTEGFKGRIYVFDTENSEVAKNMKLDKKGQFAIKVK